MQQAPQKSPIVRGQFKDKENPERKHSALHSFDANCGGGGSTAGYAAKPLLVEMEWQRHIQPQLAGYEEEVDANHPSNSSL